MTRKTIEELNIERLMPEIDAVTPLQFKEIFDLELLDEEYFHGHSSLKPASRLALRYNENGVYDNMALALVIGNRFSYKWNAMWEGIKLKYDIIENYNMIEEETTKSDEDVTTSDTENNTNSTIENTTSSNDKTYTSNVVGKTKKTNNLTTTNDNSVYAFDNTDASKTNTDVEKNTGTTEDDVTNDVKDLEVEKGTGKNEVKETLQKIANGTNKTMGNVARKLTRHGNIGVTTSSQMQEQYLKLVAEFYEFVRVVYDDLDSVLTLYIY